MASVALLAATSAGAQPRPMNMPANSETADMVIVRTGEPSRGGEPGDGRLWQSSTTVAVDGRPDVILNRSIISNTPIPDTVENRRQFGEPLSNAGRRTAPRTGPTG
jgi:hypothetical protein